MDQIVVGMAECRVGSDPRQTITTFALGSCIGLAVYDPQARVGGMAHFMLPDSSIDPERGRKNPCMFADTAIPQLIDAMASLGANRTRLVAYAAGGARMMGDERIFNIGRRNCEALQRHVELTGIELRRAVTGGVVSRNLRLDIGTGKIWLWESGALVNVGDPKNASSDRRRFRDRT